MKPAHLRTKTEKAFHSGTVYRVRGWKRLIFWPLAWGLMVYYKSLRWDYTTPEAIEAAHRHEGPMVILGWHNRSLLYGEALGHVGDRRGMALLVSASKMAAWEAAFFEWLGFHCIRGSSTRRAIAAVRELLQASKEGYRLGLSPDGPSGPLYVMQRGVVMLARQTNAPILLINMNCRHAIRLNTWDKHLVPLPFAKVELVCEYLPTFASLGAADDEAAALILREKLLALTKDPFTLPA